MSRQCSDLIVLLWAKPFAYPNGFFPTENRTKKHCHKLFDSHAKIDCLWMIYYWNNNRKGQNTRIYFEQKLVHVIYINDFKYFSLHYFFTLCPRHRASHEIFLAVFFAHIERLIQFEWLIRCLAKMACLRITCKRLHVWNYFCQQNAHFILKASS